MKKVLITGSCGFVFSNFIRRAIYEKQPYSFVSVDKVSGNANTLYSHKNHVFHFADICDSHVMDKIFQFEQPDIVIHGAAESSVDKSLIKPNDFINSNILGTQVVINCCIAHGVERLIYTSTDEVYGQLISESESPWTEAQPISPRSPHSASKAAGELLLMAAHQSHGLIYNITRSSNNYGPRQSPDRLIPKVIKCILNEQQIPVYGQGLQIRDWTHVFDNCSALLTVLNHGKPNEIYNISANQEFPNIEVVQKICNAMGSGHNLISFIEDPRKGHDFRYSMDASKIKALGWKPNYKFKDGIIDTVEWYKINQWFLK